MEFKIPQSYKAAIAEQRKLAQNVCIEDEEILLKIVAGVDVAYSRRGKEAWAIVGIVTMEWEKFQPI